MRKRVVKIVEYDEGWPERFGELRDWLLPKIRPYTDRIEHVGSTSVPGLAAKPVIDMDVVVENMDALIPIKVILVELGYEHLGDLGIPEREAFVMWDHPVWHNLYVTVASSTSFKNHLAVRDHLRSNEKDREYYGSLKRKLARQYREAQDRYTEEKTEFLLDILKRCELSEGELAEVRDSNLG